jgi:hypothetical protein
MEFEKIVDEAKRNWRNARSIIRYMDSTAFAYAFRNANEEERKSLLKAVETNNAGELAATIRLLIKSDHNIRDLRTRAAQLQIPNYSRMSKIELLAKIKDKDANQREIRQGANNSP